MVMADDENSDLVASHGTESDKGIAANSLSGYQGPEGGSRLLVTYCCFKTFRV
jgi:hypothetical protein